MSTEKGIIKISGLNVSKKHALIQHMDSQFIKSTVSIFEEMPNGSIKEIKSKITHETTIDIWAPASKNNYFVRVVSDFFAPYISKKFKLTDEEQFKLNADQPDIDSILPDFYGNKKKAIKAFLISQRWKQIDGEWHSPHGSYQDDDLEKAFFFQKYLISQEYLTENIKELQEIKKTSPEIWEKFCLETFEKTTKKQWNNFVTEEIMEELDG